MQQRRWARRCFFFGYVTVFGVISHSLIVQMPLVFPLLLGMIAPILLYMRLGIVWALASFCLVMLPILDSAIWLLAATQLLATIAGIWLGRWSRSVLGVGYWIGCWWLISTIEPVMPWSMQWFCAAIQTAVLIFNQYAAAMMLAITQTAEQRREQSLQNQLSGRIAVYSAIPAGLLVLLTLYGATVLDMSRRNLAAFEQARDVSNQLQRKLATHVAELQLAANQRHLVAPDDLLRTLVKQHPEYISALITDAQGNVSAFYKEFVDHDISGDNVSFRAYFQVPRDTGKPVVTDMFRGQQLGKDLIFAIAVPLMTTQGFAGVLEVSIAIERLTASFPHPSSTQLQNYLLLDSKGVKLWGTDPHPQLGHPVNLTELRLVASQQLYASSLLRSGPTATLSNNGEHLLQQISIDGTGWTLWLYTEMESTYWQYNVMAAITLILLSFSTLIVRHSAARFVMGYTNTLSALVRLLRDLDVGDTNPALPQLTTTSREFEQLQQSYLQLQRRIQQAMRELQQVLKEKTQLSDELELRVQTRTLELAQERDKANNLAAVKTRFLANMSHELRTPLAVIQGYAEQLQATLADGEAKLQLRVLREHSDFLLHIVNDILDSAKIEEGKLAIAPEVFALQPLFVELQQACIPLTHGKPVRFELDLKPGLPQWIYSDSYRLRQILFNLLSNALKFTDHGFVRLTVRQEQQRLLIEVTDSGIGISAEQQVRIFDAFEQADISTTRQFGGTGLGLFISRRLAELLGAKLSVHSTLGFGSCFTLQLPLVELTPEAVALAETKLQQQGQADATQLQGTLLIVDDVSELRRLFRTMLEPTGLTCLEASDGLQALAVLQAQQIDILLLDMHMPVLDGMAVLQELALWPHKPVVVAVTADVQTDVHQHIMAAGASHVLTKPVAKAALLQVIRPYLHSVPSPATSHDVAIPPPAFDELQQSYIASLAGIAEQLCHAQPVELAALLHKLKGTAACLELTALSLAAQAGEAELKATGSAPASMARIFNEISLLQQKAAISSEP